MRVWRRALLLYLAALALDRPPTAVAFLSTPAPTLLSSLRVMVASQKSGRCRRFTRTTRMKLDMTEQENETMKGEIDRMRQEALERIGALNSKITSSKDLKEDQQQQHPNSNSKSNSRTIKNGKPVITPAAQRRRATRRAAQQKRNEYLALLHGTQWKVVLNIGREEETYMPKTWGISGERLVVSMELEFTDEALVDDEAKDEFLNGNAGAKVLKVVNREGTLGPSLNEGAKLFELNDGSWRIAKGEGPLGTDIIRFYVNVAEEMSHRGGDVYIPAGRVYFSCGYFPVVDRPSSVKASLRQQLDELGREYEQLKREIDQDTSIISWDKIGKNKKLIEIRVETGKLTQALRLARVREPDNSVLRKSQAGNVALTREGGLCCRVKRGMVGITDYATLGKFGIAAIKGSNKDANMAP